jgi:hypothetical protein
MATGQRKLLIFSEGVMLGGGLGLFIVESIYIITSYGGNYLYILLVVSALVIGLLWIKLRMGNSVKGLDDLWYVFMGHDNLSEGYAVAEMEVDTNTVDKELWSKALMRASGDEKRRKFEYMKLRAAQIKKQG